MQHIATTIDTQRLVFGLRWSPSGKLTKDDILAWQERFDASQGVRISAGGLSTVGVVEDSVNRSITGHSAAAALATLLPDGVVLTEIEVESVTYIWGCVLVGGIVELDIVSDDITSVVQVIEARLDDDVRPLLQGGRAPGFFTDISSDDIDRLLQLRGFRVEERNIYDLSSLIAVDRKTKIVRLSGFSVGLAPASKQGKQIALIAALSVALLAMVLWPGAEGPSFDAEPYVPVMPVAPSGPTPEAVAAKRVHDVLADQLLGSNIQWASKYIDRYESLPLIVAGYKRSAMTCTILTGTCEVLYNARHYIETDSAVSQLSTHFSDVVFSIDGSTITGILKVDRKELFTPSSQLQISSLPQFDRGLRLLAALQPLDRNRPGLKAAISSGEGREISYEDSKKKFPDDVPNNYIAVSWTADLAYEHQLPLLLDAVSMPFLSINYINVTQGTGGLTFGIKGTYLMEPQP